ncbi:MAG: hypothetical protein NC926_11260 [Candidatus Omnitrophica bacterium]|nr:hypothetical protein [Candidatus Omnitrophota bacterium]
MIPTFVYILSLFLLLRKSKEESKFFLIFLLIGTLLVTYTIDTLPILNIPFLTTYGILLIFLSYFILVRVNTKFSKIMIIALNLIFFMTNIYGLQVSKGFLLKDHPEYYQMANIVLNLPRNERFVVLPELYISREYSIYSFAAIYKNLSTPFGHYPQVATKELTKLESELNSSFVTENCEKVREISKFLKFNFIVSRDEFCNICFNLTLKKDRACILNVD